MYEVVKETVDFLKSKIHDVPEVGLILGSGLGGVTESFDDPVVVDYENIPNFPRSTVKGHPGKMVFGYFGGRSVVALSGRFHLYEGHPVSRVVFPVYVFKMLGVRGLIVTNAAGGINPKFKPGDIVFIKDVINLAFCNPLRGPNDERLGPRFPDMSAPTDRRWWERIREAAQAKSLEIKEGVYVWVRGPSYETPAEIVMIRKMGADLVGMSTVPEIIAASHAGIRTVAFSLVTNYASGIAENKLSQEGVIEVANRMKVRFTKVISMAVKTL